jgi:electron transfer flavoprotein beta subunit
VIAACLKSVDRRPQVDPLDAHVSTDARTAGMSAADAAALEWALRAGEAWGQPVLAVTAGPAAADAVLREALAAGAARAIRVDLAGHADSDVVAGALAVELLGAGVTAVWCGDHSLDRGSGSVPAYLAAELGVAQALGLVEIELADYEVTALRRLDGGRRERLRVPGSSVLSVEGAAARLRRASLPAAMAARTAPMDVRPGPGSGLTADPILRPFRPRPRVRPAPRGEVLERIAALTDAGAAKGHSEVVVLDPAAAAERILDALTTWGYRAPPGEPAAPV